MNVPELYSKIEIVGVDSQIITDGYVANIRTAGKTTVALTKEPQSIFLIQKELTRINSGWSAERREEILREHCHYIYTINCLAKWREILPAADGRTVAALAGAASKSLLDVLAGGEPSTQTNPVWRGPVFEANEYMMKSWQRHLKYRTGQSDEKFYVSDLSDEQYDLNLGYARAWHEAGIQFTYSTGICGKTTSGYGRLDPNGYFEYPLQLDRIM